MSAHPIDPAVPTPTAALRQAGWFVGLSLSLVVVGVALAPIIGPGLPFLLALGPGVIAILLAWRDGSLRSLLASVTRRPARARWYLALLVPILGSLAVVPVASYLGIPTTGLFGSLTPTAIILPLVVLLPALAEELGWRGYALPRVMTRTSPLVASLVLAVPWAAMHLALFLPDQMYAGQLLWPSIVTVVALSVLGTWVYVGTGGSVLMTTLFHASFNASTAFTWAVGGEAAWAIRPVIFAVIAVAVVLLGGLRAPEADDRPPRRHGRSRPVAIHLAAIALVSMVASACTFAAETGGLPTAATPASTVPTAHVVLAGTAGADVAIDITDESGTLVEATSGEPGDGASVPANKLVVTNDGPATLRLTWSGGPCASLDELGIDPSRTLFLLQEPPCEGDSMPGDRVLILRFSTPIAADRVLATLQDGRDAFE